MSLSIHADPTNYFPLFAGYLPLAWGAGDAELIAALGTALGCVLAHEPAALVAALGLDGADEDPLGVFNTTTQGFREIAGPISALKLPTVLVQEGGCVCPALPRNLAAFLENFDAVR
ncbi:MAG: hypothetical protein L0Y44_16280 [Phycisphaerales bacterium]|nr:hypothetical protein [Phycisphaerales bacterium]